MSQCKHFVCVIMMKKGKEMFYLMTHSTHFIYSYMASDSERGNLLPPLHGLLFPISSKGSFICTYHILCYTSRGALSGMRYCSMCYYICFVCFCHFSFDICFIIIIIIVKYNVGLYYIFIYLFTIV